MPTKKARAPRLATKAAQTPIRPLEKITPKVEREEIEQERAPVLPTGPRIKIPRPGHGGKQAKDGELRKRIGRRFRAARMTYTDTAMELADVLDVSFQRISKIEKGLTFPDENLVVKLCYYTGITAEWLYLGITGAPRLSKRHMILIEKGSPDLLVEDDELILMRESIKAREAEKEALQKQANEQALASFGLKRRPKKAP